MTPPIPQKVTPTIEERADRLMDELDRRMGSRLEPLDGSGKEQREAGHEAITRALLAVQSETRAETVREAAKAVCRNCESGDRIFWKGGIRSGYWAHDGSQRDGFYEGQCSADDIYRRFPDALPAKPEPKPECDCDSHMDPANGHHYGDCPAKPEEER